MVCVRASENLRFSEPWQLLLVANTTMLRKQTGQR
jgi:hypothetical protein